VDPPKRISYDAGVEKVHFIGAAGAGVSALAQIHLMSGGAATGSDRAFDQGKAQELKRKLESLGLAVFPQDGSALGSGHAYAVASAAVEADNPDLAKAKALGLPVKQRADQLAEHVKKHKTIAVAGTSGKSTVAAMIFEILHKSGRSPSIIAGGELNFLKSQGRVGNAFAGSSDLLVVEADESDGTLVKYEPWLGVVLNVSKDHKEVGDILAMFETFKRHSASLIAHEARGLESLRPGSATFGIESGDVRAEGLSATATGSRFTIRGEPFEVPAPGRHNVENAVAAAAACLRAGVPLKEASRALATFQGVARRFERVGGSRDVDVVDDFAHNPAKVRAALEAAHLRPGRVLAVFQLHGYAPARFLKNDFVKAFSDCLAPGDILWMPEIYYAGGSVTRDISAEDVVRAVAASGHDARFSQRRPDIVGAVAKEARAGDLILVMGARDPSLPAFAREILSALGARGG